MSNFDDDEALFEDIYGDEPEDKKVDEEQKNTGDSEKAPVSTLVPEVKAGDQGGPEESGSLPPPPPPPPPPAAAVAKDESEQAQPQLGSQFQLFQASGQAPQGQYGQGQYGQGQYGQDQYGSGGGFQQQAPVHQPSNVGKESGKMFIGGLNWDTSEEGLVSYFSKFGEVLDHTIMRDNNTGKSRGFGFLTFRDPKSVDEVIKTDHILDGKLIDPKRAIAREEQDKVGKIFVGGIDPMVNEKDFNDFFSQFGSIIDAQLMIDKDTGRSRGFGFITYDSPEAVDRVTVNKYLTLKGKAMEVKRAEPRGQHQQNQHQSQPQNQYNNYAAYGNQYGQQYPQQAQQQQQQVQQQQQQLAAYGQAMNMTPDMMQEYWQRMQQWYLYQQQVALGQQPGEFNPAEGEAAQNTADQPDQPDQPLNPQQQASEEKDEPRYDQESRAPPRGPREDRYNGRDDYENPHRDGRRANLPKGPRRAPPSGPSGGATRGRYGGSARGGRGGRDGGRDRGYHPYSRGGGNGGRRG